MYSGSFCLRKLHNSETVGGDYCSRQRKRPSAGRLGYLRGLKRRTDPTVGCCFKHGFDLSQLDPIAVDLYLVIEATQKLDVAVR